MALAELFSLCYPEGGINQKLFHAKCYRFFSYSISNMLGLIYGCFLISLVLYIQGTALNYIVVYFLATTVIALIVFILSLYVEKKKPTKLKLEKLLFIRVLLGCGIGVMYGFSCFLLPLDATESGVLFLIMVYMISTSVAIFQYSVIPLYYILFIFSIYIPLFIYLYRNNADYNPLLYLLLISGMVMFIIKGLKVSVNEINSIISNVGLKKEAAEHIETRNKLQVMALYDDLTKVANRYNFKESSEAILDRAKCNGNAMAIIYIDLNDFKEINDQFGHSVGDRVLVETADIIRSKVRSSDFIARLGGDEFVVILEGYDNKKLESSLLKDIGNSLNTTIEIGEHKINLSASIGIASYPVDGNTIEQILHAADTGMYKHKKLTRETRDDGIKSRRMR